MHQIHVVFPETGVPIVASEAEAALTGRQVIWEIRCDNKEISEVGIDFTVEEGGARYFEGAFGAVAAGRGYQKTVDPDRRTAVIWGTPPEVGSENVARVDKYTVYGVTATGGRIALDPMIISTDPPVRSP